MNESQETPSKDQTIKITRRRFLGWAGRLTAGAALIGLWGLKPPQAEAASPSPKTNEFLPLKELEHPPMEFAPGLHVLIASGERGCVENQLGQRKSGGYFEKIGPPGSEAKLTPPVIMDFLSVGSLGNLDLTLEVVKAARSKLWLRIDMGGGAWSQSVPLTKEEKESCFSFIDQVIGKCSEAGIIPEMIVIGNEIDLAHNPKAEGDYKVIDITPDYEAVAQTFIEASERFKHLPFYLGLPAFSSGPVPTGVDPWDVYPNHYIKHYSAFFEAFEKKGGLPKNIAITLHSYLAKETERIEEILKHPNIAPYAKTHQCAVTEAAAHRWGDRHVDQHYDNYAFLRKLKIPYVIWVGNLPEPKNPDEEEHYEIIGHEDRETIVQNVYAAHLVQPKVSLEKEKEVAKTPEEILKTTTGVNADWQPNGIPISYEEAKTKAEILTKIGFSSTRLSINRKNWKEFTSLIKGIHGGDIPKILYTFQQDSISDELYRQLIKDYADITSHLIELENLFYYPENKTVENQTKYAYWKKNHELTKETLASLFADEFIVMANKLAELYSEIGGDKFPLQIEVWNEPNGIHGTPPNRLPAFRPDFYAEIIKRIDSAIGEQKLSKRILPVYGATFGSPPELTTDRSPQYLSEVLNALEGYKLKSPCEWSCHLYPGKQDPTSLINRLAAVLNTLALSNIEGVHLTEVGYAVGERIALGNKTQRECWEEILHTLYPFIKEGSLRTVQLFSFDFRGDADYSYPEEEEPLSLNKVAQSISTPSA